MHIFDKATLKLTALYTAIILMLSISFSTAIGFAATHELGRPLRQPPNLPMQIIWQNDGDTIQQIFQNRAQESSGRIIAELILINFGVLVFGAVVSYFLANWSLKPLRRAMEEESRFVSDASHELRTPLAVMITENEVTLRDKSADKKDLREQVESNLSEARKLQRLANYLLELNNSDTKIKKTEIDLSTPIENAVSRIQPNADQKKIKIVKEIQPAIITSNAETLSEIIAIILDNAVKYSPEKSEVKIVASTEEISVIDSGQGIGEDDLPHIFDRFYRAEKSRTTEGYGLGLSLAQKLAAQLGAKITAENVQTDDKISGAKFTVKL